MYDLKDGDEFYFIEYKDSLKSEDIAKGLFSNVIYDNFLYDLLNKIDPLILKHSHLLSDEGDRYFPDLKFEWDEINYEDYNLYFYFSIEFLDHPCFSFDAEKDLYKDYRICIVYQFKFERADDFSGYNRKIYNNHATAYFKDLNMSYNYHKEWKIDDTDMFEDLINQTDSIVDILVDKIGIKKIN